MKTMEQMGGRGGWCSLLDVDPDLGRLLDGMARQRASHELRVVRRTLPRGVWDVSGLEGAGDDNLGLLLLDGVLAREVVLGSTVSTELLGAGDLVRPWTSDGASPLADVMVRWNALTDVRVALLDRGFAARAAAFPGVSALLLERVDARAQRLATARAISQMKRVDERIVAMLRTLCDRWGRVTVTGTVLPLRISHRMLAELVGARRPTVSSAIADLARRGAVSRQADGSWLLHRDDVEPVAAEVPDSVSQRRRLFVSGRRAVLAQAS
jgi:CRP/FNR family cyclic AMP-dependent transcriptional regulator